MEAYRAAVLVAEEHVEDRQLVHVVMQGEGGALLRRSKVQQGLTWRLHKAERRAERERRATVALSPRAAASTVYGLLCEILITGRRALGPMRMHW